MPDIPGDLNFNFGIEQIIDVTDSAPLSLPESGPYLPSGGQVADQLTDTLLPPTTDHEIRQSLRPPITAPEVLTPHGCGMVHRECQQWLTERLSQRASATDTETIERLLDFLKSKEHLAGLLMKLRQLLQQA